MADDGADAGGIVFRASKRRKIFRKRHEDEDDNQSTTNQYEALDQSSILPTSSHEYRDADEGERGEGVGAASVRRPGAHRKAGVGFSNSQTQRLVESEEPDESRAMIRSDPSASATAVASSRFTAPSGQAVVKDDKHM